MPFTVVQTGCCCDPHLQSWLLKLVADQAAVVITVLETLCCIDNDKDGNAQQSSSLAEYVLTLGGYGFVRLLWFYE